MNGLWYVWYLLCLSCIAFIWLLVFSEIIEFIYFEKFSALFFKGQNLSFTPSHTHFATPVKYIFRPLNILPEVTGDLFILFLVFFSILFRMIISVAMVQGHWSFILKCLSFYWFHAVTFLFSISSMSLMSIYIYICNGCFKVLVI